MDRRWGYGTEQRLRDENQDTHGIFEFPGFTLAIVCDGMGGHHGGAHASALAVRTIHDALRDLTGKMPVREALIESVKRANQAIYDASRRSHRLMGMGTTVAAVALEDDDVAHVVHVGDSRVYIVRNGEARQLTRDHTMVNLFVEAELLSPEDAASHPEAHVLSRSLGVERQVEVEVQEVIPLEYADTFVLCTDGVHGVLTEWEFGRIEWSDPQEGVWEGLRLVAARQGDDNASVVAVIVGEFDGPGRPPTAPPEVDTSDDASAAPEHVQVPSAAHTTPYIAPPQLINSQTLVDIPATPGPAPVRDAVGKSFNNGSAPAAPGWCRPPLPVGSPSYAPAPPAAPAAQASGTPAKADKPKKKPKKAQSRVGLAVGLMIVGLGVGVGIVGGIAWVGGAFGAKQQATAVIPDAVAVEADPYEAALAGAAAAPVAPEPEVEDLLFAPRMPTEHRRPTHRQLGYMHPPPGGPDQVHAIQAARNAECGKSLGIIQDAMLESSDHAALYIQAWNCFNDSDQKPLMLARVTDERGLAALEAHFQGPPPEEVDTSVPSWFQAPTGGLEYRLAAWNASNDRDLFVPVMLDRLGEDVISDHLLRDVWLEATAAAGLAKLEDPSAKAVSWWARRVYFANAAMEGAVGEILRQQRPEVIPDVEALLAEGVRGLDHATLSDPRLASGSIPAEVRLAWATAVGYEPAPGARPGTRPAAPEPAPAPKKKPVAQPKPEDVPLPKPKIYRQGE